MELHRIDLRPELRPQTGTDRDGRRMPRGYGATPMSYRGEVIGSSDQVIYAAARWLLNHGIAAPEDDIATYCGETLPMSGNIGDLAKWTVEERKRGTPTFRLIPWKPFSRDDIEPPAAEEPSGSPHGRTALCHARARSITDQAPKTSTPDDIDPRNVPPGSPAATRVAKRAKIARLVERLAATSIKRAPASKPGYHPCICV